MTPHLDLSIILIVFNEEDNLPRLLASLPVGAELIVLDSASTDSSAQICRDFGAKVVQRAFTDFSDQKNAALALATRKWVFAVDADEALDEKLQHSISRAISASNGFVAFRIRRRLVFMGRSMRFGKTTDWPIRLFIRTNGFYRGKIHESLVLEGKCGRLSEGNLAHYSYKNLSDYFQRFNRYTSAIADQKSLSNRKISWTGHVLRPWFEFISRYFFRLGFLDGYPGYVYALVSSLYAFVKYAKTLEKSYGRE